MREINLTLCLCSLFIGLMTFSVSHSWGQNFALGLVSDGGLEPDAEAAYNWAKDNYNAQIIPLPKSKDELKEFGVIWWAESNAALIPAPFLEKSAIDAFLGYVEDGGGLLLSNLAFHYVFEMGIEPDALRYFGANANSPLDWTDIEITEGQEGHPIFKGMEVEDGIIQYDIQGWTEGSDFYSPTGPVGPKEGTLLARTIDGHPQCNPLVEYTVGDGTIVLIGWVWSSWVINEELEDVHGPLHANILEYLATRSRFAAVDARAKLVDTWGAIKVNERMVHNYSRE